MVFQKRTVMKTTPERLFAFHKRPDALERLTPPWERVRVVSKSAEGLPVGLRVVLELRVGPFTQRWIAEHTRYEPPHLFEDRQVSGPFAKWVHTHRIEPVEGGAALIDHVEYELPLGPFGRVAAPFVRRKLERMFAYRHEVTRREVESDQRSQSRSFDGSASTADVGGSSPGGSGSPRAS